MTDHHYAAAKLHCERGRPHAAIRVIEQDWISQGRQPDPIAIRRILEHWGYVQPPPRGKHVDQSTTQAPTPTT
jgi:hypothetical protein